MMETFNVKGYLAFAMMIIRSNTIVLWCLGLIGLCSASTLLLGDSVLRGPLNTLTMALSIIATPICYGIYFELIQDTYSSIGQIARTYVPGYIWLLIRMYLPAILVAMTPLVLLPGASGSGYFEVTLICFSLVYIYVIPTYYINGRQQGAILSGVKFLLANLYQSTPIICTVLMLETVMLLLQISKNSFAGQGSLVFAMLDFFIYLSASIIDFAVFIVLIYVLKNSKKKRDTEGPE